MSKRSTSGLPKPAQPKPEASRSRLQPKLLHEYRSKHERETEIQRLVIIGTAITVGIAVLILVGAILNEQLIVPNQSVASINGHNISVSQFVSRAKVERALLIEQLNNAISLYSSFGYGSSQLSQLLTSQQPYSTWYGELQVTDQLGNAVLNSMVEDELVRQKAADLGITVSEAEVDKKIDEVFGYNPDTYGVPGTATPTPTQSPTPLVSPTPSPVPTASATPDMTTVTPTSTPFPTATPSPTPNVTEEATQVAGLRDDFFANIRAETGVSNNDIRDYFRMLALRDKVRDAVITDVSHNATYVDARHILVGTEDEANTALQALQAGDSFASLAKAMSTDGSSSQGGELGWQAADGYVKEFADAVKSADIGALVGPVQSQYGYHIIQVRAREDRDMSNSDYQQAMNTKFSQYLKDLRQSPDTNVQIYDTWINNVPTEPVFSPSL